MSIKWAAYLCFLQAVTASCDYYQKVSATETYSIYNPEYPKKYRGKNNCRWIADCPTGYNCRLDCDISIPQSANCKFDSLLISRSGDKELKDAESYCGRGILTVTSTGQSISVALITNKYTYGGRFICQLRAQPIACSCGWRRQNRVVNGSPTGVNEYPMMVGLARADERQIRCGAVIISPNYVLTAAHCVEGEDVRNTAVVVGEHDVTTGQDTSATRVYRVEYFNIHPLFNESNYDFDIALIKVSGRIDFNERVGPVCLPFKFVNESFAGKNVTILGWGTTSTGGVRSKVLLKAELDVITQSECQRSYSSLSGRQICTNSTMGKDACQYDSGGPVLYTDPSTGLLFNAGIVSYGRLCASGYPGVNTRVTALLDWIIANTPKTNFCIK